MPFSYNLLLSKKKGKQGCQPREECVWGMIFFFSFLSSKCLFLVIFFMENKSPIVLQKSYEWQISFRSHFSHVSTSMALKNDSKSLHLRAAFITWLPCPLTRTSVKKYNTCARRRTGSWKASLTEGVMSTEQVGSMNNLSISEETERKNAEFKWF